MQAGILQASMAYVIWGLFPLYFHQLQGIGALEVLGHRIVWSLLFLVGVLGVRRQWGWLRPALADRRVLGRFAATALLIAANWFIYIWAVSSGRVIESSLGYFISPLVNVLTGWLVLKERLRPLQWLAVALASAGVVWLTLAQGAAPWIALALAATFASYGLLRKTAPLGALEGLTLETILLGPAALLGLLWALAHGQARMTEVAPVQQMLLLAAGPLTAIPLLLFAGGARRIPLSLLGMLQYIGPTLQLALGVWVFGEPFAGGRAQGFMIIWAACLVFSAELLWQGRRTAARAAEAAR
ncbi:MAG: chloramphenicol-sensitive protein RarD [Pseudomonadota bacterium]|nr:chloramphenicol-sensitive protein RarD [Pseudomonadota bacterium]